MVVVMAMSRVLYLQYIGHLLRAHGALPRIVLAPGQRHRALAENGDRFVDWVPVRFQG